MPLAFVVVDAIVQCMRERRDGWWARVD